MNQYKAKGVMPPALLNKPNLSWHMNRYLKGYLDLDRRRQAGYAMAQPLSETGILFYGVTHGFRKDLQFFFRIVSALDDDYIRKEAERLKAQQSKTKAKKRRA